MSEDITNNSALLTGIDNEYMLQTGRSAFEGDSSFGAVITKGLPLTAAAIANSFINTPSALMRTLGMDAEPTIKMSDWGFDGDTLQYYEDHKSAVEGVALVAGSFIPGFASLKLLKAAQAGKIGGPLVQAATGLFASREAAYTTKAIDAIKAGEVSLFAALKGDMYKAIAFGFGEQALQAGVWELATAATMKGNYALEDLSIKDTAWNVLKGAAVGGVIGEAVGSLTTLGKIKGAFVDKELGDRMYELFDLKGQLNLLAGDKVDKLWTSMLDIAELSSSMSVSQGSKFAAAQRQALGQMTEMLAGASRADNRLAYELTARMQEHVSTLFATSGKEAAASMLDNLFSGVKSITRINDEIAIPATPTHMLNFKAGGESYVKGLFNKDPAHINTFLAKFEGKVDDAAVYFRTADGEDPIIAVSGVHYASAAEAFKESADVYITRKGNVIVNPFGKAEQVAAPGTNRGLTIKEASERKNVGVTNPAGVDSATAKGYTKFGYFNMATGELSDEAFKHWTAADEGAISMVTPKAMKFADGSVQEFSLISPYADTKLMMESSAQDVSKRWAWAAATVESGKKNLDKLFKNSSAVLEEADLPAMDMMAAWLKQQRNIITLEQVDDIAPAIRWVDHDGTEVVSQLGTYLRDHIGVDDLALPSDAVTQAADSVRRNLLTRMIDDGRSLEEIAIKLNLKQGDLYHNLEVVKGELADYMRPTRVRMNYDISQAIAVDGNIVKGRVEQQLRMQQAYDLANTVAAKFFSIDNIGVDYASVTVNKVGAENATSLGAGQGMFTSANEDALTLGGRMKYLGSQIHAVKTKLHQDTATVLKSKLTDVLENPKASAEFAALRSQMQRTGGQYHLLTAADSELLQKMLDAGSDFGALTAEVKALANGEANITGIVLSADAMDVTTKGIKFMEQRFPDEAGFTIVGGADATKAAAGNIPVKHTMYTLTTKEAAEALSAHNAHNAARLSWEESARTAQGYARRNPWEGTALERNLLYFPPIPTERYSHYKFVRSLQGDVLDGGEQTTMIFGRTAEDLLEKEQLIDKTKYQVLSRDEVKNYHRYMGDYAADLDMNSLFTKSDLRKSGALADKFPRMNPEELLTDMLNWHQRADSRLAARYAELANPDLFTQLRSLGDQWNSAMKSKFPTKDIDSMSNPFDSYIKLGLDIAQRDKIPDFFKWQQLAESKASDAIQGVMKMFGAGKPTAEQYAEATAALERMGMGNPYKATLQAGMEMQAFESAVSMVPKQYLTKFTNAVNATVATLGIRLDVIQSAINAISTPVMLTLQTESARASMLNDLKVKVPGSAVELPGTSKLMYQAMKDVTSGPERKALLERYTRLGTVRGKSAEFVDLYDAIELPMHPSVEALEEKIAKLADMGAKATLSDQSEIFTRLWASRTAELLYGKLGYSGADLESLIYTFATRVNGNHLTSQRPLVFQGWLGQAVGLYQTYQFNLLQQMFRNIQTGQPKSVLYALGMQQTLFGMQGLPGFQAINQHIIGNAEGNWKHHDLYDTVPSYFSKDVGEFLLYGGVSALTRAGVYTRGDISPRQITVLPVLPTDWPGLSVAVRSIDNIVNTMQKISGGGDVMTSVLQGIEHNGMNRMLQGAAQIVAGQTTTSSGSLLSLTRPMNGNALDVFSVGNAIRVLGARPFDEAIALDENFRAGQYKLADAERMEKLGQVVKTKLIGGDDLTPEDVDDLSTKFAASGGRPETFNRKLIAWEAAAHKSVANQAFYGAQSPISQRMQAIMGGRQLPDYRQAVEPELSPDEQAP